MTNDPHISDEFLQEANNRSQAARRIIAGFSRATPVLADVWQRVDRVLADVPVLTALITRLRSELGRVRLEWANLAAAGRASVTAYRDGEPDPLCYLRDELSAQGFWRERP
jgi:ABC-type transporter Mla subunit MlaD